jgi:putative hydrolase of the HAD superfamily
MQIKALLFDLDGTLHSREAAFWAWVREEAGATAIDTAHIAALDARGRGPKPALLAYLARSLSWPEASLDEQLARFRAGITRHISIDPEVYPMLSRLRSTFRLGIVSNGTSASQRAKLRALRLESYFDPIIISGEVGVRKPEPEIFWLAAERWFVARDRILVVGDDENADIQGALDAGMRALLVSASGANGSSASIRSVTGLEAWLLAQASSELP